MDIDDTARTDGSECTGAPGVTDGSECTRAGVGVIGGVRGPCRSREVTGRDLRYLLTVLLREAERPLTTAELVTRCEAEGVVFSNRPSKVVSDALRWEVGRHRVVRVSRGLYAFGTAPRSTVHWIRSRVRVIRAELADASWDPGHGWRSAS